MAKTIQRDDWNRLGPYWLTRTGERGLKTNLSKEAIEIMEIDDEDQLFHYLLEVEEENGNCFDVILLTKDPLPGDRVSIKKVKPTSKRKKKNN